VIGNSVEGRNLKVIKLATAPRTDKIWIDANIHAREWLAPCSCVHFTDALITGYQNGDAEVLALFAKFEFHILCSVNPDGYEFSHTSQRLWRKNRKINPGSTCVGVDLNRNCNHKWMTGGASPNPCSDTYGGPFADSEVETIAVQEYIMNYQGDWAFFITIHTYGQWLLTSWGDTTTLPDDYDTLMTVGNAGANALRQVHGTNFVVGSSARLLYVNSGNSQDWAKSQANISLSYTFELRPGQDSVDNGYGFMIPENRCPPSGEELYAGLVAMFTTAL